jgi:hypothetical protein
MAWAADWSKAILFLNQVVLAEFLSAKFPVHPGSLPSGHLLNSVDTENCSDTRDHVQSQIILIATRPVMTSFSASGGSFCRPQPLQPSGSV